MYIRAPKTGFATLRVTTDANIDDPYQAPKLMTVRFGDTLFDFEDDDEALEILKIDISIALSKMLLTRAREAAGPRGTARQVAALRLAEADTAIANLVTLADCRRQQHRVGEVHEDAVLQAELFADFAFKERSERLLAELSSVTAADELVEVLLMKVEYDEKIKNKLLIEKRRLHVTSPLTGTIALMQRRSGWVSRGDILAAMA